MSKSFVHDQRGYVSVQGDMGSTRAHCSSTQSAGSSAEGSAKSQIYPAVRVRPPAVPAHHHILAAHARGQVQARLLWHGGTVFHPYLGLSHSMHACMHSHMHAWQPSHTRGRICASQLLHGALNVCKRPQGNDHCKKLLATSSHSLLSCESSGCSLYLCKNRYFGLQLLTLH